MSNTNNVDETKELDNIITLTDEETGEERDFAVLATAEIDGKIYYALEDAVEETEEYIILRAIEEEDSVLFETIEDDEEFEKAEDYFNDLFFNEMDYDA